MVSWKNASPGWVFRRFSIQASLERFRGERGTPLDVAEEEPAAEGCLIDGPTDLGPPVGYYAFLRDPDGHTLELSYGQEVALAVKENA